MLISVICPFYNEKAIIEKSVLTMLDSLHSLSHPWELLLVNDGSTDGGEEIVVELAERYDGLRLISYRHNQGRGHALGTGIRAAQGDLIVTTEVDLSWGEDIAHRIVAKFEEEPHLDVVVASPNIPGGGYKNVPLKRVWISRLGNRLIRLMFTKTLTMNTGMTRGYRRDVIRHLPLREKGKEFHLESLLKLKLLGYRLDEISAVLEWKDQKLAAARAPKRKSSSNIPRLIFSHLRFAMFANPIRYFWSFSLLCLMAGIFFFFWAVRNLITGEPSLLLLTLALAVGIMSGLFFGFGINANQDNSILQELWRLHQRLDREADRRDRE